AAVARPFLIREEKLHISESVAKALVFMAGFAIAPTFMALYFLRLGAWPNLLYCVFKFNELVAATHSNVSLLRILYPLELILLLRYAGHFARQRTFDDTARKRFYLGMLFGMYTITLGGFWILISPRDFLPMMPLLAIFVVAWLIRISPSGARLAVAYAVAALLCLSGLLHYTERFRDETTEWVTMTHQA